VVLRDSMSVALLSSVSAKTKSDSHDKVLVVQRQPKSCRKEARRDDNSR
jgi:hypothetical protein